MRKYVDYKLLEQFFKKYFVDHEQSAVKYSFSTYVCYVPDDLFWLHLYNIHSLAHFAAVFLEEYSEFDNF